MRRDFTRRDFLAAAARYGLGAGLFMAGCAGKARIEPASSRLPEWESSLRPPNPLHVRILQFTDLHFFAGKELHETLNKASVDTMQKLVKRTKPDLVMITGDSWPENRDNRGEEFMRYAVAQYEALGVPWAYTWGNHDQLPDAAVGNQALASARNSLYRGATTDGNYVIDIIGRHRKIAGQLVCINTQRDGLVKPQQDWLRGLSASLPPGVPRLAFFHIPLKQYDDIWKQGRAKGVKNEQVMPEKEDGSSLPLLKALGVRACFCGHDHTNDYSGMCGGVELVYGRATGAGGYGGDKLP
ncbi:MAG: metallophosphoesterase family protein, partial [Candidatus Hydrogenedentes bacterium]|nr:metallophosphoesterase family protein [Candidatus Hydrogenedentota bacterium]